MELVTVSPGQARRLDHLFIDSLAVTGCATASAVLTALEPISFGNNPLQFLLVQTAYQAFISLFHVTGIVKQHPKHNRDFVRIKFRNGTNRVRSPWRYSSHQVHLPLPGTEGPASIPKTSIKTIGADGGTCLGRRTEHPFLV